MRVVPVILAGGSGKRLWPLSTPGRPKPFAPLFAGQPTLFQQTLARARQLENSEKPVVICNTRHEQLVRSQSTGDTDILLEPEPRDTAPAICCASIWAEQRFGADACLCIMPADHLIRDTPGFAKTISSAVKAAETGCIVTIAIPPNRPATEFGYLNLSEQQDGFHEVQAFIEKPDVARANELITGPNFWNAGIFVAAAGILIRAYQLHAPDILEHCRQAMEGTSIKPEIFTHARRISFDYAIMEKYHDAVAVKAEFDWQDLGTWAAVHAESFPDTDCYVRCESVEINLSNCVDVLAIEDQGRTLVAQLSKSAELRDSENVPRQVLPAGQQTVVRIPWCDGVVNIANRSGSDCTITCAF